LSGNRVISNDADRFKRFYSYCFARHGGRPAYRAHNADHQAWVSDNRYTWSADGSSVNVYPREIIGNSSYLRNRELDSIALENINRPADALNTLTRLLPGEQLGVAQAGPYNGYPEPWSTSFSHLTVRQLMNRLSEHDGPRGGWIWSGSVGQRFFAYFERSFQRG
jgi:hypothetical protein